MEMCNRFGSQSCVRQKIVYSGNEQQINPYFICVDETEIIAKANPSKQKEVKETANSIHENLKEELTTKQNK